MPDELVLIGCRHPTDSIPPEKLCSRKRGTCVGPLFLLQEDRTARPTNKVLLDGVGHHCRWRPTLVAHEHAVVVSWHVQKVIILTDLAGEAQESRWTPNDHERPRSVPLGSTRPNRVKTRPFEKAVRRTARTIVK